MQPLFALCDGCEFFLYRDSPGAHHASGSIVGEYFTLFLFLLIILASWLVVKFIYRVLDEFLQLLVFNVRYSVLAMARETRYVMQKSVKILVKNKYVDDVNVAQSALAAALKYLGIDAEFISFYEDVSRPLELYVRVILQIPYLLMFHRNNKNKEGGL